MSLTIAFSEVERKRRELRELLKREPTEAEIVEAMRNPGFIGKIENTTAETPVEETAEGGNV